MEKEINRIWNISEVFDMDIRISKPVRTENKYDQTLELSTSTKGDYDGFKITTRKGDIYFLINNGSQCCENWGYMSTDDNLDQYIGSDLLKIELTGINLTTKDFFEYIEDDEIQFVTVTTSAGVFQLAVYNAHNGYYGHSIYLFQYGKCILEDVL